MGRTDDGRDPPAEQSPRSKKSRGSQHDICQHHSKKKQRVTKSLRSDDGVYGAIILHSPLRISYGVAQVTTVGSLEVVEVGDGEIGRGRIVGV
ncbi:hypothetical protein RND71_021288 [Anisodus tanguticus]|uniref:Uncharacterized protein n=1 Tax=Anisodus tanguticus TaxID=243964 RepID=A0AAE1RXJ0_9SOLA|nr:hypothetical protein RND71_021288 [Anisodus tanguticus]